MHIRVQNEFSVINHVSRRRGNCRKKENGCHLKYVGQIYLIFHVHILWVHVHFYAKYKVFYYQTSGCSQTTMTPTTLTVMTTHKGEYIIHDYIGSLAFMPNEPKTSTDVYTE